MKYPVTILKLNFKRPILICRLTEGYKTTPFIALEPNNDDIDSDYKRSFTIRLGEAVKGVVLGKKSIRNIKKPKKRKRGKSKKND